MTTKFDNRLIIAFKNARNSRKILEKEGIDIDIPTLIGLDIQLAILGELKILNTREQRKRRNKP